MQCVVTDCGGAYIAGGSSEWRAGDIVRRVCTIQAGRGRGIEATAVARRKYGSRMAVLFSAIVNQTDQYMHKISYLF